MQNKEYKIMTFNIQSCRDYVTREFTAQTCAKAINKIAPDILALNEVRGLPYHKTDDPSWFDQVNEISKLTNLPYYYFGEAIKLTGPYGNAILSKYPIKNIQTIAIPDPLIKDEDTFYESRCIISCEINDICVFVTHVGLAKGEQKNAISLLKQLISEKLNVNPNQKIILMGDFNMTPDNILIKEINNILYDTANSFKEPLLSFPSINPKIKIDYIFTSNNIEVIKADIPQIVASDHFPYYISIK